LPERRNVRIFNRADDHLSYYKASVVDARALRTSCRSGAFKHTDGLAKRCKSYTYILWRGIMKAEHTGEKWRNKLFRVLGKEREERKEPERPIEEEISILEREEAIDAAIEMTFPASDPPSWMP